jgi:hypothetical protein
LFSRSIAKEKFKFTQKLPDKVQKSWPPGGGGGISWDHHRENRFNMFLLEKPLKNFLTRTTWPEKIKFIWPEKIKFIWNLSYMLQNQVC